MELLVEKVKGYYYDKLQDKDSRDAEQAGRKAHCKRHAVLLTFMNLVKPLFRNNLLNIEIWKL